MVTRPSVFNCFHGVFQNVDKRPFDLIRVKIHQGGRFGFIEGKSNIFVRFRKMGNVSI
jgi:hypothetical protein